MAEDVQAETEGVQVETEGVQAETKGVQAETEGAQSMEAEVEILTVNWHHLLKDNSSEQLHVRDC